MKRSFTDYMVKTVLNYFKNYVKMIIKSLCETQSDKTNDIVNKKTITKIICDLDVSVCKNQIIKSQYV